MTRVIDNSVLTMPECVLGDDCEYPSLDPRVGHMCPGCLGSVHVFCGEEDPEAKEMHLNVTCNACLRKKKVSKATPLAAAAEPEATTQAAEATATKELPKTKDKKKTATE